MTELPLGKVKNESELDEDSISELTRFFLLLDKWDREAKQDPKALPMGVADQRRDLDMP